MFYHVYFIIRFFLLSNLANLAIEVIMDLINLNKYFIINTKEWYFKEFCLCHNPQLRKYINRVIISYKKVNFYKLNSF
jgi:hypothetical protein